MVIPETGKYFLLSLPFPICSFHSCRAPPACPNSHVGTTRQMHLNLTVKNVVAPPLLQERH